MIAQNQTLFGRIGLDINSIYFLMPRVGKTFSGLHTLRYDGVTIWNSLPIETKNSASLCTFKENIAKWGGHQCKCYLCK